MGDRSVIVGHLDRKHPSLPKSAGILAKITDINTAAAEAHHQGGGRQCPLRHHALPEAAQGLHGREPRQVTRATTPRGGAGRRHQRPAPPRFRRRFRWYEGVRALPYCNLHPPSGPAESAP
ncbi:hypothetical protein GCM10020221_08890 [Streptomyces thioluteus]|uniref:Uncharacterized protein n=1 Tax=Streptomyces thioluteus TaxID=66431 RepID=A0ABN3WIV0_STRTU